MVFNRSLGIGLIVGVSVGSSAAILWKGQVRKSEKKVHRASLFGLPAVNKTRNFDSFIVEFDTRTKTPQWVLEHITKDSPRIGDRKNVEFKEDAYFEERFRSRLIDYKISGYDRGHMAPAANHKKSQEDMDQTFLLTNVAPQVGKGFNRDYWARFESFARSLMYTCDDVYIVTGPLFLPSKTPTGYQVCHPVIGRPPNFVSVPTHFFKVILGTSGKESKEEGFTLGAFVMPNSPIDPNLPLTAFSVPLEPLESFSGLQFFPKLVTPERQSQHDLRALSWQNKGQKIARMQEELQRSSFLNPLGLSTEKLQSTSDFDLFLPSSSYNEDFLKRDLPTGLLDIKNDSLAKEAQKSDKEQKLTIRNQVAPVFRNSLVHADYATSESLTKLRESPSGSDSSMSHSEGKVDQSLENSNLMKLVTIEAEAFQGFPEKETSLASKQSIMTNKMMHLCDHIKCRLPPPDWYMKKRERKPILSRASELESSSPPSRLKGIVVS